MGEKVQTCSAWLEQYLGQNGTTLCDTVREKARKEGFGIKELKEARKALGVKTFHQFDEDGETPNWFWYLED